MSRRNRLDKDPNLVSDAMAEMPLEPREDILDSLRAKFEEKRAPSGISWRKLLPMLNFRIPLYQAALCSAVLVLLVLYSGGTTLPADPADLHVGAGRFLGDTTSLVDSVSRLPVDEVGRSLGEDSVLARFINAVL